MSTEVRDQLISRVVDRCDSAADWRQLAELQEHEGEVWHELAQALRCEAELRSVLAAEIARADRVEVTSEPGDRTSAAPFSLRAWSGWLTAAACLLGWLLSATATRVPDSRFSDSEANTPVVREESNSRAELAAGADTLARGSDHSMPRSPERTHSDAAVTNSDLDSAEALSADVIRELPMIIVDTKLAEGGQGYEVVYLRRVLESRRVNEVLELAPDETGAFVPIPADSAHLQRSEAL